MFYTLIKHGVFDQSERAYYPIYIIIKSNHMTFFVQFGNNLHSCVFQKAQIAFILLTHAIIILILFEKPSCANYFQIELEVTMITYTNSPYIPEKHTNGIG